MTFDFTEQQVTYLMQVLATRPYGEVCDLIAHIHRQASGQAQQPQQAQPVRFVNGSGQALKDEAPAH
jgi:hypothetical protein